MNPLTNVRNIAKLNDQDIKNGIFDHRHTWHSQYKDSAYLFIGGLPYDLTEGDILCVFSQYGEIVNINLVRDKKTGKSKGYGFLCYEDQRSTILAVDNFNAIKLGGRTIRVDHVSEYRRPKGDEKDESGKYVDKVEEGCAPKAPSPSSDDEEELLEYKEKKKKKKDRKKKKRKKEEDLDQSDKEISKRRENDNDDGKQRSGKDAERKRDIFNEDIRREDWNYDKRKLSLNKNEEQFVKHRRRSPNRSSVRRNSVSPVRRRRSRSRSRERDYRKR